MVNLKTGLRLYKPLLWKKYFDTGYGVTNYVFKVLAVFGLTSHMVKETIILVLVYSIFCVVLGRIWLYSRMADTEKEIANMFDPFVYDMRKKFNIPYRERFK